MIRVMTEHHGERTFPDDHVPEILEAATLHIVDGAGKTVLLVAEGEWRTVEVGVPDPLGRLQAIEAVLEADCADITDGLVQALYDAAVNRA